MNMGRHIDLIVVHCSATPPSMDIGANEIRKWHKAKGWRDIGYHNVIRRNGVLEHGRDLSLSGAHAKGFNKSSIGVCMAGGVDENGEAEDNFNPEQYATLRGYIDTMKNAFPDAATLGHRDLSVDLNEDGAITPDEWMKECPCFDVKQWYKKGQ